MNIRANYQYWGKSLVHKTILYFVYARSYRMNALILELEKVSYIARLKVFKDRMFESFRVTVTNFLQIPNR